MLIIEALLGVLDRLVGLLDRRNEANRELFEDHVEPLFLDLAMIHKDYCEAFITVERKFCDRKVELHELANTVLELRTELEGVREKVLYLLLALEDAMDGHKGPSNPVLKFVNSASRYFKVGAGEGSTLHPEPGSTYYTTLLDLIYLVENQRIERLEAESVAEGLRDEVRDRWSDVTRSYADARVALLPVRK